MIALPIYLQMVLEYDALQAGLSIAPLSLSMFGVALLAGKRSGGRRPGSIVRGGFALFSIGVLALLPIVPRADSGWALVVPLVLAGSGLGLLVSPACSTHSACCGCPTPGRRVRPRAWPSADQGRPKRSMSTPCRRPRSLTVSESRPSRSSTVRTMQAPARITSARAGCRPTIWRRCSAELVR
jgi:hypothetical protein